MFAAGGHLRAELQIEYRRSGRPTRTLFTTPDAHPARVTISLCWPLGLSMRFDHFWDRDGHNKYGPTATPIIFSKITIEGNGATLQWQDTGSVPGNSRLFAVGTVNDVAFPRAPGI